MMPENPIDAYLAAMPDERRSVLEVLRKRIRDIVPDAEEVTSYGIPAFRVEGKVVIGFKANKSDYSIYPFSGGAAERFPEELQGRPSPQARSTSPPRTRSRTTCSDGSSSGGSRRTANRAVTEADRLLGAAALLRHDLTP